MGLYEKEELKKEEKQMIMGGKEISRLAVNYQNFVYYNIVTAAALPFLELQPLPCNSY